MQHIRRFAILYIPIAAASLGACGSDGPGGKQLHKTGDKIVGLLARLPLTGVAGEAIKVECIATYDDSSTKSIAPPDVDIQASPGMGVTAYQSNLTFANAGTYSVSCASDQVKMSTPATIQISANQPATITTILDQPSVPSGTDVHVTCQAKDSAGNVIQGFQANIEAMPPNGVTINGMTISTRLSGQYTVSCVSAGMHVDVIPAELTVTDGAPATVKVDLSQYTSRAGDEVMVTCVVNDAAGNLVHAPSTFAATPVPSAMSATSVSPTRAGDYQVTCSVPSANLTSAPVTLHVTPGLPASLSVTGATPQKMIYAGGNTVTLTVDIQDRYHNPSPADWNVQGLPAAAALPAGDHASILVADGDVTLIATVTGMTDNNHTVAGMIVLHVDARPPDVVLDHPARAEIVQGTPGAPMTISGHVTDPGSGVQSFMLNNDVVTVDQTGHFIATMTPAWGINLIQGVAIDNVGNHRSFAQSFELASRYKQANPTNPTSHRITDGILAHLGAAVFDDGNPDVDDLSTIARLAIDNANIASRIPDPVTNYHSDCSVLFVSITGDLQLHVDNVTYDEPAIHISPISGGVHVSVTVPNVTVYVHTTGDVCDVGLGISGTASADAIHVEGDLYLSSSGGVVSASMPPPSVGIDNLNIHINLPSVISWAVDGIINLFDGAISSQLDSAFAGVIQDQVPPVLRDFLQSMNLSTGFALPQPINLTLNVSAGIGDSTFDPGGGTIGMDTTIFAAGAISPEPRGAILQETHASPTFRADKTLGVGISYDLVNQALYAIWYGGALDIDLTHLLSNQMGMNGQTVPVTAHLTGLGSPVLAPTNNPAYPFKVEAGDLKTVVSIHGVAGLPDIDATVYATVSIDANLTVDQMGLIQISIGPTPQIVLEIDSTLASVIDVAMLQSSLANTLQTILPQIVGQVLHGIPIPHFDLSQIAGGFLPPGIVLGLANPELEVAQSYLLLQGDLAQLP